LAFSLYNGILFGGIYIIVTFFVSIREGDVVALQASLITVVSLEVVVCLFAPKIYYVRSDIDDFNINKIIGSKLGKKKIDQKEKEKELNMTSMTSTPPTSPNKPSKERDSSKQPKIADVHGSSSKSFVEEEKTEVLDNPKDGKDTRKRLHQLREIYNTIKQQYDLKVGKLTFKEQNLERFKRKIEKLTNTLHAISLEISYLSELHPSTSKSYVVESPRLGPKGFDHSSVSDAKNSPIQMARQPSAPTPVNLATLASITQPASPSSAQQGDQSPV